MFTAVQVNLAQNHIIPKPVSYKTLEGTLALNKALAFEAPKNLQIEKTIDDFKAFLTKANMSYSASSNSSIPVKVSLNSKSNAEIGEEGYVLELKESGIDIQANTEAGIWNAFQSLKQLVPISKEEKVIEACKIVDFPR